MGEPIRTRKEKLAERVEHDARLGRVVQVPTVMTKLEERQKRERRANDAKSKDANEANEARESACGNMRWMPSNELYDDEVRVLCARARACRQYFLFMPFHPHMLGRALSLVVRPVLLLRRHGSLSFG